MLSLRNAARSLSRTRFRGRNPTANSLVASGGILAAAAAKRGYGKNAKLARLGASLAKKAVTSVARSISRKSGRRGSKRAKRNLRKTIKSVISQEEQKTKAVGTYNRCYGIDIENELRNIYNHERLVYGGMRGTANAGAYTQLALAWTPHSVAKIMDATSVLFNAKTPAINYENGAGNLNYKLTKADVKYSSFKLTLRNVTQMTYEYTWYTATNKANSLVPFLETVDNKCQSQRWVGNALVGGYPDITYGTQNSGTIPNGLKWGMIEGLSQEYSITTGKSGIVSPGGSISYFDSKKEFVVDFAKHGDPDLAIGALSTYCKGDKQVLLRIRPILGVIYDGSGSYASHSTRDYNAAHSFVGEVEEVISVMVPENAPDADSADTRGMYIDYNPPASVTGLNTMNLPLVIGQARLNPIV